MKSIKSLYTCALCTSIFMSVAIASESTPSIPDSIYSRITLGTLQGNKTSNQIAQRNTAVRAWMASVGGNAWYQNYSDKFGFPSDPKQIYIAEQSGLSKGKLSYYYIHQPLTSPEMVTWYTCQPGPLKTDSPTIKGLCALSNWNAFILTKDLSYQKAFMEWANHAINNNKDGKFEWSNDVPARGIKGPWISSLTQSLYVSVLLRSYQQTGETKYLDQAKLAYGWIVKPVSAGGTLMSNSKGTWLEEYPNAANPSHVLNGHIWALFGVWDYYRVTKDPGALKIFRSGVRAIKSDINKYDMNYWIVYAQTNRLDMVEGFYMQFIAQQMLALYGITGDSFFKSHAAKWAQYQNANTFFIHMAVENFLKANTH